MLPIEQQRGTQACQPIMNFACIHNTKALHLQAIACCKFARVLR
jgi:hypothetical protein